MAVTRRIQRLSKDFFDLCQHIFFFKCGLKSRGYIEEMCGPGISGKVISLPRYHFIYYNLETEDVEERWLELETARPHIEGKGEKREVGKQAEQMSIEGTNRGIAKEKDTGREGLADPGRRREGELK